MSASCVHTALVAVLRQGRTVGLFYPHTMSSSGQEPCLSCLYLTWCEHGLHTLKSEFK